jgi:hypothetical protein
MAIPETSSPSNSPLTLHQHLAAKLADACVNPSYMPDLWTVYFYRFQEVLAAELGNGPYPLSSR